MYAARQPEPLAAHRRSCHILIAQWADDLGKRRRSLPRLQSSQGWSHARGGKHGPAIRPRQPQYVAFPLLGELEHTMSGAEYADS